MFWTLCSFVFQPFPTLTSCLAVELLFSEVVHCRWSDTPAFFSFLWRGWYLHVSGLYVRLFSLVSIYVRVLRAVRELLFSEVVHCRWSDTPAFFSFLWRGWYLHVSGLYVRLFSLVSIYVRVLRAVCRLWCSFCSFMCHLNLPNAISIYGRGALRALLLCL